MHMSFDIRYNNILIDTMEQMCDHIAGTKKQYFNCYVPIYNIICEEQKIAPHTSFYRNLHLPTFFENYGVL